MKIQKNESDEEKRGKEGKEEEEEEEEEEENLSIGTQWEQSPTNRRLTWKDC